MILLFLLPDHLISFHMNSHEFSQHMDYGNPW